MNSSPQQCAMHTLPVIAGHEIAIDEHGRFSLNAIHHAGGELPHKRPSQWARRDEAKDLVAELAQSADLHFEPLHSIRGGAHRGTYAHELLAVSYAGWISPRFQLQVNQVFLDYRMGKMKRLEEQKPTSSTLIGTTIGTDGFRCLAAVLDGKVRHLPGSERRRVKNHIWQQVHKAFSVVSAEDIPAEQLDSARNFLAAYTVEGEWLPAPEAQGAVFTDDDLSDLYVLLCHVYHLHRKWHASRIEQAMMLLESPVASRMCEHLSIANSFTTRLSRTKGELMEAARKRQGTNYGILPPIH